MHRTTPLHALTLASLVLVWSLPTGSHAGSLSGPVLDAGATAELVDVLQLPASSAGQPRARISTLREAPDNSGRLFVNDQRGALYVVDADSLSTYLDLTVEIPLLRTSPGLQMGFQSFAFHPDFASNGLFYTAQTEDIGSVPPNLQPAMATTIVHHAVLTEWQATDPTANVFSGTRRELMRIAAPHRFHNLGEIDFDPHAMPGDSTYGLLYVAAGDFGAVIIGEPDQLQRLDTVFGCLLRIDPLGTPFQRDGTTYPYGIPAGNPFAHDGDDQTFDEIWATGFRNPQTFDFDPLQPGRLFVADIGQDNLEEINRVQAGSNHGWPEREGTYALDVDVDLSTVLALPANDSTLGYTYPVAQYDHEEGNAVAGGLAVRQGPPSLLADTYVFGDIVTGRLFYAAIDSLLDADDGDPATTASLYELHVLRNGQPSSLLDAVRDATGNPSAHRTDVRFHVEASGRLYVTTKQDGWIRELLPTVDVTDAAVPTAGLRLHPNVPNPFNPRTQLSFRVPRGSMVRLRVHDVHGREIRVLAHAWFDAGEHRVIWDGSDQRGRPVASGVYVVDLQANGSRRTTKVHLIR